MCSLRDHLTNLHNAGAVVFGISVQDVSSHHTFAEKYHLNFPILADADKKVAQSYGVLGSSGFADRVTFVIGPDGKIQSIDRAMRFERGASGIVSTHGDALELALTKNWQVTLNRPVPSFTLPNYDGAKVTSTDADHKLTVITFISTQCPVSNAYNERMAQLAKTYGEKGVRFLAINANNGETPAKIEAHAKAHNFPFPVLKDDRNVIADHFNAQHTPEVWVLDRRSVARYHGGIDDSQNEASVQNHYLADTLDALLDGKAPAHEETRSFGCTIKRVRK